MGASFDLRDRVFRSFQQPLHFLHINLRRRIVLMPHHLLHAGRVRIVEQRKVGGGMMEAMHDNPRLLQTGQEQPFRDDPMNRARGQPLPGCRHEQHSPWWQTADRSPSSGLAGARDTPECARVRPHRATRS